MRRTDARPKGACNRSGAVQLSVVLQAVAAPRHRPSRLQGNGRSARCSSTAAVNSSASTPINSASDGSASQQRRAPAAAGPVLVDGLVVQPAYRSTPWEAEAKRAAAAKDKAIIMFVSESGICRGPLAAAAFKQLLQHSPLQECVAVEMRATRDYCEGQQPDPAAAAAAHTLGFSLDASSSSSSSSPAAGSNGGSSDPGVSVFQPSEDIVAADLVLVMDKYTAADVLREVSSYDLINPGGHYSSRVRLLGSYHPLLASQVQTPDGQDIDDALYGNMGGEGEQVKYAAKMIVESCRNLLHHLEDLAAAHGLLTTSHNNNSSSSSSSSLAGSSDQPPVADDTAHTSAAAAGGDASSSSRGARLRSVLVSHVRQEGVMEWLVPPMLQGGNVDVDGWI